MEDRTATSISKRGITVKIHHTSSINTYMYLGVHLTTLTVAVSWKNYSIPYEGLRAGDTFVTHED